MKTRNELLNEVKTNLQNRYYLDQEQQELINDCVDELLKAINYIPCCEQLTVKEWEIDFGGDVLAGLEITNNEPKIIGAMNGWGNAISKDDIKITQK